MKRDNPKKQLHLRKDKIAKREMRILSEVIFMSEIISNKNALRHFHQGISKRLLLMQYSFHELITTFINQEEGLDCFETMTLTIQVNL